MSEKPSSHFTDYLNPMKLFPSLGKAFEKAKDSKDTNFLNKIGIFFSSFFDEMKEVDEEKDKAKEEVAGKEKAATDTKVEDVKTAAGSIEGSDDDKKFYDEVLGMATVATNNLKAEKKSDFDKAFVQLQKAVKGESTEKLTLEQSTALGAVGLKLIAQLKEAYPKKEDLKKAFDTLESVSAKSNYPLKDLLAMPVLKVFNPKIESYTEISSATKLLSKFGMDIISAGVLLNLTKSPIKDEDKVVEALKKHVFPNTDAANIKVVAEKISEMISKKADHLDTTTLTEFVFDVDKKDFDSLIIILGGKENAS